MEEIYCSVICKGMDDREWMYTGRSSKGECTDEWIAKTQAFLKQAFANTKGVPTTFCPCAVCDNRKRQTEVVMGKHLVRNGFTENYTRWTRHGEAVDRVRDEVVRQRIQAFDDDAGVGDMLDDYGEAHFNDVPREEELEATGKGLL